MKISLIIRIKLLSCPFDVGTMTKNPYTNLLTPKRFKPLNYVQNKFINKLKFNFYYLGIL